MSAYGKDGSMRSRRLSGVTAGTVIMLIVTAAVLAISLYLLLILFGGQHH